jgi:hypothetical protein
MAIDIFKIRIKQTNDTYRKICDSLRVLENQEYEQELALLTTKEQIRALEYKLELLEEEVIKSIERKLILAL